MNKRIPYGRHDITEDDIKAVTEVLKSEFLTQGPAIAEFEEAFAEYIGVKYAVAVANGTAALHLSTLALGVRESDKVITTPITFSATANCIRYAGGEVVFADIDPDTYLLDIKETRKILEKSPRGTIKGIIPVDFAGRAVELDKFRDLADEFGLWILEDACHAPGGYFTDSGGRKHFCGNGEFAELAIFSFHPVKHIAAGEGGMVTTNNEEFYHKIRNLRTHGIQQRPELRLFNHGPWYYEMQELGFNYRLTDIQAALGKSQLGRAEEGLKKRIEIAKKYAESFSGKKYILGQSGFIEGHAYHLYILEIKDRLGIYNYLREKNIFSQIHYIPVHLMPYYRQYGWQPGDFPNSEKYYESCISIPLFPGLSFEEQEYIINSIEEYYNA